MGRSQAAQALIASSLALATVQHAHADDPLRVSVPEEVAGDGRTVVPVVVTGKLPPGVKELPATEVATVTCEGAATLAAVGNQLPAALAPAVTKSGSVECVARLRDVESPFRIRLRPPQPGLFAASTKPARTTDTSIAVDTFVWDGKRRRAPGWLRATVSDGEVKTGSGGALTLTLTGRAPRTIAIAMIDGTRAGVAFVPVTGVTVLPVEAGPDSTVQVWIAGRWYGPVPTKGKIAEVPIEVPPGVTHAVARSTNGKGYVTDAVIDLKIPARPRIASIAAEPNLGAGEQTTLAIAIVGSDGRPGAAKLAVQATAERGRVEPPRSLGGGLWSARYTAPATQGSDRVTFKIAGDARAGTSEVDLDIRGIATRVEVATDRPMLEPGSELTGTVRVFDSEGTPLRDPALTVTLGGEPIEVVRGESLVVRGRVPERVAGDGTLPLVVVSGSARTTTQVRIGGAPARARVRMTAAGDQVRAEVDVRDRFGNLVHDGTFELVAVGGKLSELRRDAGAFHAVVTPDGSARVARLGVWADGRELAEARVRLSGAGYALGAYASAGWLDNLGAMSSPRASAGIGFSRSTRKLELAVLAGVESLTSKDSMAVSIGGATYDANRSLAGVGIPLALRARLALTSRVGLAAGAAFVPARIRVTLESGAQAADEYSETVLGVRGLAAADLAVGPGRVVLGVMFGRGALDSGSVVGQIDGLAVSLGYEWWFAALGE